MVQRVDDHSSWVGKAPKGCVFPDGVKKKQFESAEGVGELKNYEQSTEEIKKSQMMADRKVKENPRKDYHRN